MKDIRDDKNIVHLGKKYYDWGGGAHCSGDAHMYSYTIYRRNISKGLVEYIYICKHTSEILLHNSTNYNVGGSEGIEISYLN